MSTAENLTSRSSSVTESARNQSVNEVALITGLGEIKRLASLYSTTNHPKNPLKRIGKTIWFKLIRTLLGRQIQFNEAITATTLEMGRSTQISAVSAREALKLISDLEQRILDLEQEVARLRSSGR